MTSTLVHPDRPLSQLTTARLLLIFYRIFLCAIKIKTLHFKCSFAQHLILTKNTSFIFAHNFMFWLYWKGMEEKLWKLGKLNHVAIAVPDLGKLMLMNSWSHQNDYCHVDNPPGNFNCQI